MALYCFLNPFLYNGTCKIVFLKCMHAFLEIITLRTLHRCHGVFGSTTGSCSLYILCLFSGFSKQIVQLMKDNNVKFGSFNILSDEEVRQGM